MTFHKVTFYHKLDGAKHNFDTELKLDDIIAKFSRKVDDLIVWQLLPNNKKKRVYKD